jgi:hypothetical protein
MLVIFDLANASQTLMSVCFSGSTCETDVPVNEGCSNSGRAGPIETRFKKLVQHTSFSNWLNFLEWREIVSLPVTTFSARELLIFRSYVR